jgi:hypothetical protein
MGEFSKPHRVLKTVGASEWVKEGLALFTGRVNFA